MATKVPVEDNFGITADPKLPSLASAIKRGTVQRQLQSNLSHLVGENRSISLRAIRVVRYKPERRCMIEYDVELHDRNGTLEKLTLIGKVRARRYGHSGFRLLSAFWNAGFRSDSEDGISVPEPIGTIPKFHMWLQRKVPGTVATDVMASSKGDILMSRIADAAYKIHSAKIQAESHHTMADELLVLRKRLTKLVHDNAQWAGRIQHILEMSERLGSSTSVSAPCGIHRDFYPDQIIVDGDRLYITDFDLYCWGDPALDIGNFLGHITEFSLRTYDNAQALSHLEESLKDRFAQLSSGSIRPIVDAYATLTLVRHIYLSTLFPERRVFTEKLLDLCEERLGVTQKQFSS